MDSAKTAFLSMITCEYIGKFQTLVNNQRWQKSQNVEKKVFFGDDLELSNSSSNKILGGCNNMQHTVCIRNVDTTSQMLK
jgi:hypothetical protein